MEPIHRLFREFDRLSNCDVVILTADYFLPLLRACVRADIATLFCGGVDFGFERILLAFDAIDGDVCSLLFSPVAM